MCAMRGNKEPGRASPYKKLINANKDWVAYVQLSKLMPNKAYKVLAMMSTNHDVYGPGQQVTVTMKNGGKYRTQLPGKYLGQISDEDVQVIKSDIVIGKNPYLIFREQLPDNSYRIDLVEKDDSYDQMFNDGSDVPEIPEIPEATETETDGV